MITQELTYRVACDRCGDEYGSEDRTTLFLAADSAREAIAKDGWTVAEREVVCSDCTAKAWCELFGHTVEDQDWIPIDDELYRGRIRWCQVCGHTETDPPRVELADLPPLDIDEPGPESRRAS